MGRAVMLSPQRQLEPEADAGEFHSTWKAVESASGKYRNSVVSVVPECPPNLKIRETEELGLIHLSPFCGFTQIDDTGRSLLLPD